MQWPQYYIPFPSRKLVFWLVTLSAFFALDCPTHETHPLELVDRFITCFSPIKTCLRLQNMNMHPSLHFSPLEKFTMCP